MDDLRDTEGDSQRDTQRNTEGPLQGEGGDAYTEQVVLLEGQGIWYYPPLSAAEDVRRTIEPLQEQGLPLPPVVTRPSFVRNLQVSYGSYIYV